ncbi:Peroxiredoxin (plasmid) [Vibrio scophthalmi]|nr:Peroxiredoxin [Vibrio scophthalmi]ANS88261.1 Peroxiredoxin [Vibrio scophthalmi]
MLNQSIVLEIKEQGVIEHIFNQFKTKDHHEVVLAYLNQAD